MGLRLFLPESWTGDAGRMDRARVPQERRVALTKPEIAIEEIDRVIASGARFGCVLADAKWRKIGWRRGTKGKLTCLFAARRVRVADGHKHRMADGRVQAMPGEQDVWLVGERRTSAEQKY